MAHRLSPQAEFDLLDTWLYVAADGSIDVADRFVDALTARFFLLAQYPLVGRERDDLAVGIRLFPVGEYVILYRLAGEDVLILRVVRGNRDLELLLGE